MNLIKQINEQLDQRIVEAEQDYSMFMENLNIILDPEYHAELFETAQQFLSQLASIVTAGKAIDPAGVAEKLAAFQLLADSSTAGAALSKVAADFGKDAQTKLSTILQKASGVTQSGGEADLALIKMAKTVAKASVAKNTEWLSNIDKMDEKTKRQKVVALTTIAQRFRQMETGAKVIAPANPTGGAVPV